MLDISDLIRDGGYIPIPGDWVVEIGAEPDKRSLPGDVGGLDDVDHEAFTRGEWSFVEVTCRLRDADRNVVGQRVAPGLISGCLPGEDEPEVPERQLHVQTRMAIAVWDEHWESLSEPDLIRTHLAALEIDAHQEQKAADRRARLTNQQPTEPTSYTVLISDVCARTIAELYHAGGDTPGYQFARTGAIPEDVDTLLMDLFRDLPAIQRRVREGVARPSQGELFGDVETEALITTMLRYLVAHGPRGEVAGWREQSWTREAR